jgi:hypothetical protein
LKKNVPGRLASIAVALLGVAILTPVQPAQAAPATAPAKVAAGSRFAIVRTLTLGAAPRTAGPEFAAQNAMTYQGGPVLHSPSVYLWFWGQDWNTGAYAGSYNAVVNFYSEAGGSAWAAIMQQYCSGASVDSSSCPGGAGFIGNPSPIFSPGHAYVDTGVAVPSQPSQTDIEEAVTRAATHFGYLTDAVYMVYTPSGRSEPGFTALQYCAFHSAVQIGVGVYPYAYMPYLPDAGRSCGANVVRDPLDGWSIIGGHEYAEAVTDPFPGTDGYGASTYGWYDNSASNGQGEIGDKCSWSFASPALVTMNGSQWPVQPLFSNRALASGVNPCVFGAADCNLSALNSSLASPQAPNTPVAFTGVATCVNGASSLYSYWVHPPSGSWSMVQDFGPSSVYNWPGGQTLGWWTFQVIVRGSTETIPYDNFVNLSFDVTAAPCAAPTLTPNTASPAFVRTPVLLTAGTSGCGVPPAQYQFWIRTPDSAWHLVRDYSASNTFLWSALDTLSGTYTLEVAVRNSFSSAPYDAYTDIAFSLYLCTAPTLSTGAAASPYPTGAGAVTLTGGGSCSGGAQYEFWVRNPALQWSQVSGGYHDAGTFSWPADTAPGNYMLEVDLRPAGSAAYYVTYLDLPFQLTGCTGPIDLHSIESSPQVAATTIHWSGSQACSGTPAYQFWVKTADHVWHLAQDWSAGNSFSWSSPLVAGNYVVEVATRNQGAAHDPYDGYRDVNFSLLLCTAPTLSTGAAVSPYATGAGAVTLTGAGSCAGSTQYQFWIRGPAASWRMVQDYGPTSAFSWAADSAPGNYMLEVDLRPAGSTASYVSYIDVPFQLSGCTAVPTLTSDLPGPQARGTTVTFTAGGGSCSGTPQYEFWVYTPGIGWAVARTWGSNTYSWSSPAKPGSYTVEASVRNSGAAEDPFDTYRDVGYLLS